MKKLTKEEINDFKPSYYNQMKVEHHDRDSMDDYHTMREITIISPVLIDDICIIFDNIGNVTLLHLNTLMCYKSLIQPEWTMKKILSHPEIKFGTSFTNRHLVDIQRYICPDKKGDGFYFYQPSKNNKNGYDGNTNAALCEFHFLEMIKPKFFHRRIKCLKLVWPMDVEKL